MTRIGAPAGLRPPRGAVVGAAVAVGLLLVAVVGGRPGRDGPPLDPRSDGPLGTSALVSLVEGLGGRVELSVGLPSASEDVALLLTDRLDDRQAGEVGAWVQGGGTLVVVDPSSRFVPPIVDGPPLASADEVRPGSCSIDALARVGPVEVGAAVRFAVDGTSQSCFGDPDGAFVVTTEVGAGRLVAVGGAAFLTNELLDEADNAVLAATLLSPRPGTVLRLVDPPLPAGGGDETLTDLVPGSVKRALLQLGAAFVLYALWRAIRLGRPVAEDQPVAIAGSDLVAAIGRLLSRSRAPGAAAEAIRSSLRATLRRRLGVPPDVPEAALVDIVVARTGVAPADVAAAVGDQPVTTDAQLLAVARAAATVHQEVSR